MRAKDLRHTYVLTAEGIDECSEALDEGLHAMGMERRNCTLIRLAVEEALLRMRDHTPQGTQVTLVMGVGIGGASVRVEWVGEPYNPLGDEDDGGAGWGSLSFASSDLKPQYDYAAHKNMIRISFANPAIKPSVSLLAGIAAGVGVGIIGRLALPVELVQELRAAAFAPFFEMFTRLLNAIAAPVIFFMVVTTLINMRKVEERGGNRRRMVVRYFVLSYAVGTAAVLLCAALLTSPPITHIGLTENGKVMLAGVVQLVPSDILDPFSTSNTPQLLLLAFVAGNALIALGERAKELTRVVRQVNMANSLITTWASTLVPVFTGVLLALEIWNPQGDLLAGLWSPLLLSLAVSVAFFVLEALYMCHKLHVGIFAFVSKVRAPFEVALKAGTLDASFGEAEHSCVRELGIDATFTDVVLPQGEVLYMPASIVGTLIFTVFCAGEYGVEATTMWYVTAIVLDVLLFVATPPVPGANLLAFMALFMQLGIPAEAFVDAMVFDIVYGLFANAANQALLQIEMALQAERLGLLNHKVLQRHPR